jgi:hypothetical protein
LAKRPSAEVHFKASFMKHFADARGGKRTNQIPEEAAGERL